MGRLHSILSVLPGTEFLNTFLLHKYPQTLLNIHPNSSVVIVVVSIERQSGGKKKDSITSLKTESREFGGKGSGMERLSQAQVSPQKPPEMWGKGCKPFHLATESKDDL